MVILWLSYGYPMVRVVVWSWNPFGYILTKPCGRTENEPRLSFDGDDGWADEHVRVFGLIAGEPFEEGFV